MQDMLTEMHAVLRQMQSKQASGKGQSAADNVHMWELLLGHLDKTFAEARMAAMQRSAMFQRPVGGQNPGGMPRVPAGTPIGAMAAAPPAARQ
jgi:hypothetical protein